MQHSCKDLNVFNYPNDHKVNSLLHRTVSVTASVIEHYGEEVGRTFQTNNNNNNNMWIYKAHNVSKQAESEALNFFSTVKPGFHYPSWRPELTGKLVSIHVNTGRRAFPLAELTGRVVGPSTRLVETRARQHGPCWLVMETGLPSPRAINSGRQLG